jgi:hypothetical protein
MVSYIAYHGTHSSCVELIRSKGVIASENEDDWLGYGSYFFVEGLDAPQQAALDWAMCENWDKAMQLHTTHQVALFEVLITAPQERIFDLRDTASMQEFHRWRRSWLHHKLTTMSINESRPTKKSYDTEFLNEFKSEFGISIIIGNFHIQLSTHERYFRLDSRVPNVSVLCLSPQQHNSVTVTIRSTELVDQLPLKGKSLVCY